MPFGKLGAGMGHLGVLGRVGTPASGVLNIFTPAAAFTGADTGFVGGSLRNTVTITGNSLGRVRVTFKAGPTTGLIVDHAAIGIGTGSNGATTATPLELLFSGGHGFNIAANATITSDWVTLAFTTANVLVVIIDGNNPGPVDIANNQGTCTNCRVNYFVPTAATYNSASGIGGSGDQFNWNYGIASVETSSVPPVSPLFLSPFAANSPWNIKPVNPMLGAAAISTAGAAGTNFAAMPTAFCSQMFYATGSEPSNTVSTNISDEQGTRTITVPHWPAGAIPATGGDHHMEIYDSTSDKIYAFWLLTSTGPGTWSAGEFAVYDANGIGWGSPSKPAGPRAAGIAAIAGMPRTWEQDLTQLNHALAFGADIFTIKNLPIFPATQQDVNDESFYTGQFPYGTRLMLPASFDLNTLVTSQAKALARTLMTYGGFIVDITSGTGGGGGFNFYGEIGSTWPNASNFNGSINVDLDTMRNALRPLVSQSGWQDKNNNSVVPPSLFKQNLLSMRGPWAAFGGGALGANPGFFNTITKNYEFPDTTVSPGAGFTNQSNRFYRDETSAQPWHNWNNLNQWYTTPTEGANYNLSVVGSGAPAQASARLKVFNAAGTTTLFDSGNMFPGDASQNFTWPAGGFFSQVYVAKNAGPASSVRLELVANDYAYPVFPSQTIGRFYTVSDVNTGTLHGGGTLADVASSDSPFGITTALQATFNGSNAFLVSQPLTTGVDCRNGSIRITFKPGLNLKAQTSSFQIVLWSDTSGSLGGNPNNIFAGNSVWFDGLLTTPSTAVAGRWQSLSIPINAFTSAGTGVDLTSIKLCMLGPLVATNGAVLQIGSVDFVPNPRSKAAVIVRFDDGAVSSYSIGKPLLDAVGAPAFLAISPSGVVIDGNPAFFLSTAQVTSQLAAGWQFGSQTFSTEDQATWEGWTLAQQLGEFASDRNVAKNFGHFKDSYDGTYFSNVNYADQIVWPAFKASFRTVQNYTAGLPSGVPLYYSETFPFGDPYNITTLGLSTLTTPSTTPLALALDQVRASKGVLIVSIHSDLQNADNLQAFKDMITYVTTTHPTEMEFTTMRKLLAPYNGDDLVG
jgi:hypothetical protein